MTSTMERTQTPESTTLQKELSEYKAQCLGWVATLDFEAENTGIVRGGVEHVD